MQRAQELIGLPVIDLENGKEVGTIKDVLVHLEVLTGGESSEKVEGFLVESKGLFRRSMRLALAQVVSFGEDGVMIRGKLQEQDSWEAPEEVEVFGGSEKLLGKAVFTREGKGLGEIQDVYFLEEVGKLIGYELSDGFLEDVRHGRRWLKPSSGIKWGEDALIVSNEEVVENREPEA